MRRRRVCAHSKRLALPRASDSGEITLSGSRCLHSTLAAAPVLFAHTVVTAAKNRTSATPYKVRTFISSARFNARHSAHSTRAIHARIAWPSRASVSTSETCKLNNAAHASKQALVRAGTAVIAGTTSSRRWGHRQASANARTISSGLAFKINISSCMCSQTNNIRASHTKASFCPGACKSRLSMQILQARIIVQ